MKARISKVWIEHAVDDSPDTSYLGEYSNTAKENAIDREEQGDWESGQYRYFNPAQHHDIDEWSGVSDKAVVETYAKQIQGGFHELDRDAMCEALNAFYRTEDYKRMESLQHGDWCYLGVIAKAEIVSLNGICQTLRSSGLWGVESDSGKEYLAEVAKDELDTLRSELEAMGFGKRAIAHAFKSVETVNR